MISPEEFYEKWHSYFRTLASPKQFLKYGPQHKDDDFMDVMLLIVLDDVPAKTINDILAGNMAHFDVGRSGIWLAGDTDYETLPDFNGPYYIEGTKPTVEATWRSPFVGKSLAEAVEWVRDIPKPPKPVCKVFFAVLQKDRFEQNGEVLICKIKKDKSKPQTLPCDANHIAAFQAAYYRDNWREDHSKQIKY